MERDYEIVGRVVAKIEFFVKSGCDMAEKGKFGNRDLDLLSLLARFSLFCLFIPKYLWQIRKFRWRIRQAGL